MIDLSNKTVGVIGGKGKTGSQFARLFRKLGADVLVSDLRTRLSNEELISRSDIVVFSVPLHLSEEIIRAQVGNLKSGQIVLDVSSLKTKQVKMMNKGKAEVIGMHPLFGPTKRSFDGLTLILCPGNCRKLTSKGVGEIFKMVGMKVVEMSAEEHDKLMTVVQVVPHLKTILAGELLRHLGIHPDKSREISTPIYRLELDIIGRIFSQEGMLYSSIVAGNPNTKDLLKFLKKTVDSYLKEVETGNVKALDKRFSNVQKFLGKFSQNAFDESEQIINEMQKWMSKK
ncbi:prephenate dehydrogenase/arogenate dehydrogenase family protein [Candidatus Peregrinibacteria bacterium]|jgi:prephenate dehydrogenase|nr:prephenate dehydrogenase/arogenate dehydrogenase family protein [Candidatus Peregrinibacteria bacterium]MBT4056307.1 prephenate dehydrogenase/arogenate dehydrogenase family protein [Candidatus Peregrinibacteria bacterium]